MCAQNLTFFQNIAHRVQDLVPASLITVTFFDFNKNEAFRVFSTMPEEFPISGRKKIQQTETLWNTTIFQEKQCFTINRVRDYPEHFYDHAHIERLGLSSAICAPIMTRTGTVVGTINMLDAEGSQTDAPLEKLMEVVNQLSSVYEESVALSQ